MCEALADATLQALALRREPRGVRTVSLNSWPSDVQAWAAAVEQAGRAVFADAFCANNRCSRPFLH